MPPGRLSVFLLLTLMFPIHQVVSPHRDANAEETVAANFLRLRHEAGLMAVKRIEGATFSVAACEAAEHGNPEKVWVENANYAAMIYSTPRPDAVDTISSMATRDWKADQKLIVGACQAKTPTFESGRYWIAVGVLGGVSERSIADLLSGRPATNRPRAISAIQTGE